MLSQFIGSTSLLWHSQCQNDIWVTQGDLNHPVLGDTRIIIQGINLGVSIIYCEVWSPLVNAWMVMPMPGFLRAINMTFGPGVVLNPFPIPHNLITNHLLGAPVITGYLFQWDSMTHLDVDIPGVPLWYIPHACCQNQDIYLCPRPRNPQWRAVDRLEWGMQVNVFRRAWL